VVPNVQPPVTGCGVQPKDRFLFVAFMVYCDKTGCDVNQCYPLEPFIMCPVMIRRKLRYVPMTWHAVAFVPDLESKSAAEKEYIRRQVKGATARNYHRCLHWILDVYVATISLSAYPIHAKCPNNIATQ
jgi:hypothetical protein